MPQIEVLFEVPLKIAWGLARDQLELNGGVVVDKTSKQVVAWLKEGAKIVDNSNLANGVLKNLLDANSGGLVSLATGAINTAVTARSHFLIMQQLHGLTTLVGIVGGIGLLNLATSAISAGLILKRMNDLEKAVHDLGVEIAKQFAAVREIKLQSAINAANLAFNMDGQANKDFQANSAIIKLFEARQHIWLEINTLKGSSRESQNNELMQKNMEQAMRLDMLYSRCLMMLENNSLARTHLEGTLTDYRETSRCLVHRHLGTHRAAYFHNSILESDLLRYIAIERWLRSDPDRLLEILLANRRDFWNTDVADGKGIKKPGKDRYVDALTQCELLIENYGRFEGFLAEIRAVERLGISYSDWEKQQEEALAKAEINLAEHDDYVLLVDQEWLAEQSDSTAA
ncbi:MAG: hypothetical protein OXI34_12880 [Chloroflexota bacterium]|nr:hypothetical protein [Chloroflexota bacterium]MDE2948211.1 hypothetical protein [Chloroflexota bacterium]